MQGAITTIDGLQAWFYDRKIPFWTVRYYKPGGAGEVVARQTTEDNLDASWQQLSRTVADQSRNSRAQLQCMVYSDPKNRNNYDAITNIELSQYGAPLGAASIGSLPQINESEIESRISGAIQDARERWELEARIAQLEEEGARQDPADKIFSAIERLVNSPLGNALVARIMGVPLQPVQVSNVAGTPTKTAGGPDSDADQADTFDEDIDVTASTLGISDIELASKLRKLVEANPEMAKNLLNSI